MFSLVCMGFSIPYTYKEALLLYYSAAVFNYFSMEIRILLNPINTAHFSIRIGQGYIYTNIYAVLRFC